MSRTFSTTVSDEHDTEYELEVQYDVEEADPSVGIMTAGVSICDVTCTEVTHYLGKEHKEWKPADRGPEFAKWFSNWCAEMFDADITDKANEHLADSDVDDRDYEPDYRD